MMQARPRACESRHGDTWWCGDAHRPYLLGAHWLHYRGGDTRVAGGGQHNGRLRGSRCIMLCRHHWCPWLHACSGAARCAHGAGPNYACASARGGTGRTCGGASYDANGYTRGSGEPGKPRSVSPTSRYARAGFTAAADRRLVAECCRTHTRIPASLTPEGLSRDPRFGATPPVRTDWE